MTDQGATGADSANTVELAERFESRQTAFEIARDSRSLIKKDTPLDQAIGVIVDVLLSKEPAVEGSPFRDEVINLHLFQLPSVPDISVVQYVRQAVGTHRRAQIRTAGPRL